MFCHFEKCIPLLCYLICIVGAYYTQEWAVHIQGGSEIADHIAQKLGFINHGKILGDYYLFQHHSIKKRSTEPSQEHHSNLLSEPQVSWAKQQIAKVRVKRGNVKYRPYRKGPNYVDWNDPFWDQMWYLNRGAGNDMNVQEAWREGVTGKGVVVTILDDGLETDHPDIAENYDPAASYDVNSLDSDPTPRYDVVDSNRHGTRCAGEVAAVHNNSLCAVGVAYEAKVGGVRMLDGDVTDAVEARSLSLNPNHIDIYSASWGPDDDGKTVDGPGELATQAFQDGVKNGRNGKGSIFIWASGNGGRSHDNCNCDGYTNSIWTLSISSATENGGVPWYSEACSSTLATTYSSGGGTEKQIITTDLHHGCTASHTGTSASAPIAAGIAALVLSANKDLTWRDMQHIVVRTARKANLGGTDWATNGVGRKVSHSFGYGLMDASAMVRLARQWQTVPEQKLCEVKSPHVEKVIPGKSHVTLPLNVTGCSEVQFLEHVQAKVTMSAMRRGDIEIFLDSPSGTRSTLLALRPHDQSKAGFKSWPFMTVHSWGERPHGVWLLEIHNDGHFLTKVSDWKLVVHGTASDPQPCKNCENISPNNAISDHEVVNTRDYKYRPILGFSSSSCSKLDESGHCLGCADDSYVFLNHCIAECPTVGFFATRTEKTAECHQCHYSCRSCTGSKEYDCTSCYDDAVLNNGTENDDNRLSCYPLVLLNDLNSAGHWYVVLVSLFLVLFLLVVVLVSVECYRQCCRRDDGQHAKLHPIQYHMLKDEPKLIQVVNPGPLRSYSLSDDSDEEGQ